MATVRASGCRAFFDSRFGLWALYKPARFLFKRQLRARSPEAPPIEFPFGSRVLLVEISVDGSEEPVKRENFDPAKPAGAEPRGHGLLDDRDPEPKSIL